MNVRRLQTWVLRLIGTVEILAFAAVIMPPAWMDAMHNWLGLPETPKGAVFDSVMRQVSFTYGLHGVALWLIAGDVVRYHPLVILTGIGYLLAGPTFFLIDFTNRMPWFWTIGNGGSCVLIGLLVLGLLWAEHQSGQRESSTPTTRRMVRLHTIDDLAAEIDHITQAVEAGKVRPLGKWSPAQVLWHIGKLIELSFDGFPFRYRRGPQWLIRLLRLLAWRWLIRLAFRPGFQNPPEASVLEPDPALALAGAAAYLREQIARIRSREQMTQACSAEGPYSHQQWLYIHLRHAELHLSFLAVKESKS